VVYRLEAEAFRADFKPLDGDAGGSCGFSQEGQQLRLTEGAVKTAFSVGPKGPVKEVGKFSQLWGPPPALR